MLPLSTLLFLSLASSASSSTSFPPLFFPASGSTAVRARDKTTVQPTTVRQFSRIPRPDTSVGFRLWRRPLSLSLSLHLSIRLSFVCSIDPLPLPARGSIVQLRRRSSTIGNTRFRRLGNWRKVAHDSWKNDLASIVRTRTKLTFRSCQVKTVFPFLLLLWYTCDIRAENGIFFFFHSEKGESDNLETVSLGFGRFGATNP